MAPPAGPFHLPGSTTYKEATTPFNAAAVQHPAQVAAVGGVDDVVAAVRRAAAQGWRIAVQATGHSAAGELGTDTLLVASGLDSVEIDPSARTARVGAGVTWAPAQQAAWEHGLLGLSGSAGGVGCMGYHCAGGFGWLVRPHGMASARLRAVDFVDGNGRVRRAEEGAADPLDVEALWAFRGGGGVGVATALEFGLVPAARMWAGYLAWPVEDLAEVAAAWRPAITRLGPGVTTALGVLRLPPVPVIPEPWQGRLIVRLVVAAAEGTPTADEARAVLADLPAPGLDTLRPVDPTWLAALHLDPPTPVPGLGEGRWLTDAAITDAGAILAACGTGDDFPFGELELRHVDAPPSGVDGALTTPEAPVLTHAISGPGVDPPRTEDALATVRRAMGAADTGRRLAGFCDGRTAVPDALDRPVRTRLLALHDALDPYGTLMRPIALSG